ncbi:MAG: hypothetical protein IPM74_03555 [Crocinitomicaceae bacterium]|nr:hypothetical protein [Crocinitomicaceae bacterium]MBK8924989.1 hypothetical protein [Crocinitomicaceae bacterium]
MSKQLKMTSTNWHEAGHVVFANIFKDYIVIQEVTIIPGDYGKGGVRIGTIKSSADETILDHFHWVVANLAGLVVEFATENREDDKIFVKILSYLAKRLDPNDNTTDSFDGDFEHMQDALNIISTTLGKSKQDILSAAMIFIGRLLLRDGELWKVIDSLALELEKSKSINNSELNHLFSSLGFNQFIVEHKLAFIEESKDLILTNEND